MPSTTGTARSESERRRSVAAERAPDRRLEPPGAIIFEIEVNFGMVERPDGAREDVECGNG